MATRYIKLMPAEVVESLARITGPASAAAQAMKVFEERTARGEHVAFYEGVERGQRYIFVGPVMPESC